jgi:hypothetical protein
VYGRDDYTCQYCAKKLSPDLLSIDHLIPVKLGGHNEITNYVTACRSCNSSKRATPLEQFAKRINIQVEDLPIHGDPIIDNESLPIEVRLLRKRIFEKVRSGEIAITGKAAQKKIEKVYRREFWQTNEGKALEAEFPNLPGHVRVMLPEIQTIAKSEREYFLLLELAKSANTRNLIGTVLVSDCDVESVLLSFERSTKDEALKKRVIQAKQRFIKELRRRGILND